MKLDWIENFIEQLPEVPIERKNLISIAGYPKWENVNSNLLAFYFDKNEEHGFLRLFFNSLLEICELKIKEEINIEMDIEIDIFETDYTVEREVFTENDKRIDILLKEENEEEDTIPNWAIIIENKILQDLYNDLLEYWNSVTSNFKIGIVLSIKPIQIDQKFKQKSIFYINIIHRELIEKVKENLPEFYLDSDDRHLLFLKEYILNINSFYQNKSFTDKMDETLKLFREKGKEIKELKSEDLNLLRYISKAVFEVMTKFGFPPNSTKETSKSKLFFVDRSNKNFEIAKRFRFWINLGQLRYNTTFEAYFELWGKSNTRYGDKLKMKLEEKKY